MLPISMKGCKFLKYNKQISSGGGSFDIKIEALDNLEDQVVRKVTNHLAFLDDPSC